MTDPALLDLRHDDAERRVGRADQVGALDPRRQALGERLLEELVDPPEDRGERAAGESLVLLVEEPQRDEVRGLELERPLLLGGLPLFLGEGAVHADDLERLLLEVVRLLDVEREDLENHLGLHDDNGRNEVRFQLVEDGAPVVAVGRPVDSGARRDDHDRIDEPIEALDRLGEALDVGRREVALVRAGLALGPGQEAEDLPVPADGLLVERQDPTAVSLDLRRKLSRRAGRFVVSHWFSSREPSIPDLAAVAPTAAETRARRGSAPRKAGAPRVRRPGRADRRRDAASERSTRGAIPPA